MHSNFVIPNLPSYTCSLALSRNDACLKGTSLKACQHDLKKMLGASGYDGAGILKGPSITFHPAKFAKRPEEGGV